MSYSTTYFVDEPPYLVEHECAHDPFDAVPDGREPSRHHYFYFIDGTVVLKVI